MRSRCSLPGPDQYRLLQVIRWAKLLWFFHISGGREVTPRRLNFPAKVKSGRGTNGWSARARCVLRRLQPLLYSRHNNRSIRQKYDKEHLSHGSFNRVRKADRPKRNGRCPELLRLKCADQALAMGRFNRCRSTIARAQRILWTSCWLVISRLKTLAGRRG